MCENCPWLFSRNWYCGDIVQGSCTVETLYKKKMAEDQRKLEEAGEDVVETPEQLSIRRQRYCELVVGSLKAIVDEIRSSKVFLGPDGLPVRRKDARVVLKKNDAV